jgi:hypothetical protein
LLKNYLVADVYGAAGRPLPARPDSDWAIAELEEPLGRDAGWLPVGPLAGAGQPLIGHLGYRLERSHAMSLDFGCQIIGNNGADPLLWDDCEAAQGDSGGPVLAFFPDGPHVIAITVLSIKGAGGLRTGAVRAASLTDLTLFPKGARAVRQARVGVRPGKPPASGGQSSPLPVKTIESMRKAGADFSLAALAQILNRRAGEAFVP